MHNLQLNCQLGCNSEETQEHIMKCKVLPQNRSRDQSVEYKHIYGDAGQQQIVTKVFSLLLEEREAIFARKGSSNLPVGPLDPYVTVHLL